MAIEFVQNYTDLSTDKGYQFKFFCDKCGNGYVLLPRVRHRDRSRRRRRWRAASSAASSGKIGSSSYEVQRAIGGPVHETRRGRRHGDEAKFKQLSRVPADGCAERSSRIPRCESREQCAPNLDEATRRSRPRRRSIRPSRRRRACDWLKDQRTPTSRRRRAPSGRDNP